MFIFLIIICAIACSALVYPLSFFATHFEATYTFTVSALLLVLLAVLAARQVKKHGARATFAFSLRTLIVLAGILAVFAALFSGKRLLALLALAAAVALFVLAARFFKSSPKELALEAE